MPVLQGRRPSSSPYAPHMRVLGFTLIELAISLLVLTLLATVLLTPVTTQITQSRISQARTELERINDALIGFALSQSPPRLPCPADINGSEQVPGSAGCPTGPTVSAGGSVPWVTLGVPQYDPWGQRYQYRVNGAFVAPVTLTSAGSGAGILRVCGEN
ncbi:MAG: hypothetical protein ABIS45_10915, partial [Burkholderiales bacterium]